MFLRSALVALPLTALLLTACNDPTDTSVLATTPAPTHSTLVIAAPSSTLIAAGMSVLLNLGVTLVDGSPSRSVTYAVTLGTFTVKSTADRSRTSALTVRVLASPAAPELSTGDSTSGAVGADGALNTWSSNSSGHLGDGDFGTVRGETTKMLGLTCVTSVAMDSAHSLATQAGGTVSAWGENLAGQLDSATLFNRYTPVPGAGVSGAIALSGRVAHTAALRVDGSVWQWDGVAGTGSGSFVPPSPPAQVPGLSGVVAVAAGAQHVLALKADRSVWAFGWNNYGGLGDGTTMNRGIPQQVAGSNVVVSLAAGNSHRLALRADGAVSAFNWNKYGQLGDGAFSNRSAPVPIAGLTGVRLP